MYNGFHEKYKPFEESFAPGLHLGYVDATSSERLYKVAHISRESHDDVEGSVQNLNITHQ